MTKTINLLVLLAVACLLTSCAERWVKPGAGEQEFEATRASCVSQSYAHFPPLVREVLTRDAYTTPMHTNCNGNAYSVNCTTSGGQYVPASYGTVDDNEEARTQDVRACFFRNGWQLLKDE